MTKVISFLFRIVLSNVGVFLTGYIFKFGWNSFLAVGYNLPMATLRAGVGFTVLLTVAAFIAGKIHAFAFFKEELAKTSPETSNDAALTFFEVFTTAGFLPVVYGELWIYDLLLGGK